MLSSEVREVQEREAFAKWARDEGGLVTDQCTPVEWDEDGNPESWFHSEKSGIHARHSLLHGWLAWQARSEEVRRAAEALAALLASIRRNAPPVLVMAILADAAADRAPSLADSAPSGGKSADETGASR